MFLLKTDTMRKTVTVTIKTMLLLYEVGKHN